MQYQIIHHTTEKKHTDNAVVVDKNKQCLKSMSVKYILRS